MARRRRSAGPAKKRPDTPKPPTSVTEKFSDIVYETPSSDQEMSYSYTVPEYPPVEAKADRPTKEPKKEPDEPKEKKPKPHQVPNERNIARATQVANQALKTYTRLRKSYSSFGEIDEKDETRVATLIKNHYGFKDNLIEKIVDDAVTELAAEKLLSAYETHPGSPEEIQELQKKVLEAVKFAVNHYQENPDTNPIEVEVEVVENLQQRFDIQDNRVINEIIRIAEERTEKGLTHLGYDPIDRQPIRFDEGTSADQEISADDEIVASEADGWRVTKGELKQMVTMEGIPTRITAIEARLFRKNIKAKESVILDLFDELAPLDKLEEARDHELSRGDLDKIQRERLAQEYTEEIEKQNWRNQFRELEQRIQELSAHSTSVQRTFAWLTHDDLDKFNNGFVLVKKPKIGKPNFVEPSLFQKFGKQSAQEKNLARLKEMVDEAEQNYGPVAQSASAEKAAEKDQSILEQLDEIKQLLDRLPADTRQIYNSLIYYNPRSADKGFYPSLEKGGVYTIKPPTKLERLRDRRPPREIAQDKLESILEELRVIAASEETPEVIQAKEEEAEETFFEKKLEEPKFAPDALAGTRIQDGQEHPVTWEEMSIMAESFGQDEKFPTNFPELVEELKNINWKLSDEMIAAGAGEEMLKIIFDMAGVPTDDQRRYNLENQIKIHLSDNNIDHSRA